jgi:hypothetical protein
MKLGDALGRRQLAPNIHESAQEATAHLDEAQQERAAPGLATTVAT